MEFATDIFACMDMVEESKAVDYELDEPFIEGARAVAYGIMQGAQRQAESQERSARGGEGFAKA